MECDDYDLCDQCFANHAFNQSHTRGHRMRTIHSPEPFQTNPKIVTLTMVPPTVLQTQAKTSDDAPCPIHSVRNSQQAHSLKDCAEFEKKSDIAKWRLVNKSRICPLCLKSQHPVTKCSLLRTTPRCRKCEFTHDSVMGCRPTILKQRDKNRQESKSIPKVVPGRASRETLLSLRYARPPPNKPSSNGTCEDLIDFSSSAATVNAAHIPEQ